MSPATPPLTINNPSAPFQLLTSLPAPPPPPTPTAKPRTIFILDSSFNPPTTAHLHLAVSALRRARAPSAPPPRLLLLLASRNADKAASGASVPQRIEMMRVLGGDVRRALVGGGEGEKDGEREMDVDMDADVDVDVGLTTNALFLDKAKAVAESGVYGDSAKLIFILGFDTLARLLEVRYYSPPSLVGLGPLFDGGVRVHLRPVGERGGKAEEEEEEEEEEEQRAWIRRLGEEGGVLERGGGERRWAERIEVVGGQDGKGVSSSEVRRRVRRGEGVGGLVTDGVEGVIRREGLYVEEG